MRTTKKPTLDDAIKLAVDAHAGQVDKAGEPYILHPLRVMLQFRDEREQIVAVLHDVLEVTKVTEEQLIDLGYDYETCWALKHLTRTPGEPYEHFIAVAASNEIARRVKLADLRDNMDLKRLRTVTDEDRKRQERYRKAYAKLNSVVTK